MLHALSMRNRIAVGACVAAGLVPAAKAPADPLPANPTRFRVELLADLATLHPDNEFFHLMLVGPGHGFPPALYATSGPFPAPYGMFIYRIDPTGGITVASDMFNGTESMILAEGPYGNGLLVSEPLTQQIERWLPSGVIMPFANVGTAPFGPAQMTYGPDGLLYVADLTAGRLARVHPDGTSEFVSTGPDTPVKGNSYVNFGTMSGFVIGTFHSVEDPMGLDSVLFLPGPNQPFQTLAAGLDGVELISQGPGGPFGTDVYIPTMGTRSAADGAVYAMTLEGGGGTLRPFLTNIDAISAVFDTQGVMGGGMFVSDITNRSGAGKIWRITPILCYANCDGSTQVPVLNVNDFICFQNRFAAGDPFANCDGSTAEPILNINDFVCFQSRFVAGCP